MAFWKKSSKKQGESSEESSTLRGTVLTQNNEVILSDIEMQVKYDKSLNKYTFTCYVPTTDEISFDHRPMILEFSPAFRGKTSRVVRGPSSETEPPYEATKYSFTSHDTADER